ncbi:hypothetical protein BHM03_00026180 [Ensete ventricosum]|nr:hypothetical protein BHM03_00026180 [Ensete ventricosum]
MSFASSHSESYLVEMSTHRSRVLSHPSGDSRSSALISVSESVTLADPGTVDALVAMRSEVLAAPCDRGVPQRVADFAFLNGAQLMTLSGSFPMGMLCVGHNNDPRFIHGLFSPKPRTCRVYLTARAGFRAGGAESEEAQPERDSRALGGCLGEHHCGPLRKGERAGTDGGGSRMRLYPPAAGFHFITARIDRVHDAGRLVQSQHERILTLRAANKELKGRVDQDLVTIAKAHGTGWVNYEFGYRVALERLWGKHPKVEVEQDPFAECPEDANVMMDLS